MHESVQQPESSPDGFFTSAKFAALVLVLFWLFLQLSVRDKSPGYDEGVHVASGYSYWQYGDFRLNPENGNLPQRMMALPFLLHPVPLPPRTSRPWALGDEWRFSDQWMYRMGNDPRMITALGRASISLLTLALGGLVWAIARACFGPRAGLLALIFFIFCPTIIANGALMTSDTAAALFFLASAWAIWMALQRLTVIRAAVAGLLIGGLFASKMSAALILPVGLILTGIRLCHRAPLPCSLGRTVHPISGFWKRLAAVLAGGGFSLVTAFCVIWIVYGMSFPMVNDSAWHPRPTWSELMARPTPQVVEQLALSPDQERSLAVLIPDRDDWTERDRTGLASAEQGVLTPGQTARLRQLLSLGNLAGPPRVIGLARDLRILPEAFLYGTLYAWQYSQWRDSFLNGVHHLFGTPWFFPYTFLVKTPLALIALCLFGCAAILGAAGVGARALLYRTAPLWVLFLLYWTAVLASHVNIGHRHILATYPPLIILASASALFIGKRITGILVIGGTVVLAVGVLAHFPNYLAYVNGIVGEDNAYRHLVDSSLDWGQELPAIARYIDAHPGGPVYVSYFGSGSPAAYGVNATFTNCTVPVEDIPGAQAVARADVATATFAQEAAAYVSRHPEFEAVSRADHPGGRTAAYFLKRADALALHPGLYLISATRLQLMLFNHKAPWGPWNRRQEAAYQAARRRVSPLYRGDDFERRLALTQADHTLLQAVLDFDALRFARLTAYLRQRQADDVINGSVVVFRLTAEDLARALDGPPPELGEDLEAVIHAISRGESP